MTKKQLQLLIELIDAKIECLEEETEYCMGKSPTIKVIEIRDALLESCETPGGSDLNQPLYDFAKDATEENRKSPEEIHSNMCAIEENLNKALEHIRDGKESDTMMERISEIKLHILRAKNAFDLIDNFTTIK